MCNKNEPPIMVPHSSETTCTVRQATLPALQKMLPVLQSGEPPQPDDNNDESADDAVEQKIHLDPWTDAHRPKWQQHSEQGPNLQPQGQMLPEERLPDSVNPRPPPI